MKNKFLVVLFFIYFFSSCSTTKFLNDGEYAINKVKIEIENNSEIKSSKFEKLVHTKPMRRFLGIPIYAMIYNIPSTSKIKTREDRWKQKLERVNERIVDKKVRKTIIKYRKKKDKYKDKYRKYEGKNEKKYQKYYKKYEHYLQLYRKKMNKFQEEADKLKKNDVFLFYDIFYKLGEEPQKYDTTYIIETVKQFKIYLRNKGYYNPKIEVIVEKKNKKVNITYKIDPSTPLLIDTVIYNIPTKNFADFLKNNNEITLSSHKPLDLEELQNFRTKFTDFVKDRGYYFFVKDYISYQIDTTKKKNKAIVYVNFYNPKKKSQLSQIYRPWKIKEIRIFSDYNSTMALKYPKKYFEDIQTDTFKSRIGYSYIFMKKNEYIIKPKIILNELYLFPNDIYKISAVKTTYKHLSKFKIYKLVNIEFEPTDTINNFLDCQINLTPTKRQNIIIEVEGTNNSGNLGAALNLKYTHLNLFRIGAVLELKTQLSYERQAFLNADNDFNGFNTHNYLIDLKLTFPKLITPFKQSRFIERSSPKTLINTFYNFENRPEYTKASASAYFQYFWKSSDFISNYLTISRLSYIQVYNMADFFKEWLEATLIKESYEKHFIIGPKYNVIFSNQGVQGNNYYINYNFATSGIILDYFYKNILKDTSSVFKIPYLDVPFSQFIKTDIDFRYYFRNQGNTFVVRQFLGVAYPFGNSKLIPFGERYFAGGANDIRAWTVRSLGPGTYVSPDNLIYPNQLADIKIETNLEYRFKIVSLLEGAYFFDIGNIWAINKYDQRPGAIFYWNKFYKQMAVGTGLGLRLNLQFIIIRFDVGMKLKDPSMPEGHRWIPLERPYNINDFTFNIAVGYPF